ncbi:MAG: cytochrome b/b6 domain-containing protein [Ignavibacteriae bacterium]|nr:cytochrome b/b6 domain-containing protein [Ignavibacteriota bacterium]MCB9257759.1 cytochrome b/b6 domain-containing protein [Ignavibacteriales bacterium]
MTRKVYVYRSFERFWHWLQAILIIFLAFTGFEIHGGYSFFGFEEAVAYHNIAAYLFITLIVFAIFWHFTTGEWKQYLPTYKNLTAQMRYYLWGIFNDAPHPTKKTVLRKLNPMQKLTYFGLKVLVIPIMVSSGILYILYRYPQRHEIRYLNIDSLEIIAIIHTIAAFFLVSFVIVHLYLITTGETLTSNLKAMFTGYEELEDDDYGNKNLEEKK